MFSIHSDYVTTKKDPTKKKICTNGKSDDNWSKKDETF